METSVLPNILDVAKQYGLKANPRTIGKKECRFKCPFCRADAHRPGKFFLSVNGEKNVYKCWYCLESGGVLKLMAFFENRPEGELIEELRKRQGYRYQKHPAEALTRTQLEQIGYEKVDWIENREYDPGLYRLFREHVYQKWLAFVESKRKEAYRRIYAGLLTGSFQTAVRHVEATERELGEALLEPALEKLASRDRSCEELETERFVAQICRQAHPFDEACDDLSAAIENIKGERKHEPDQSDRKDDQGSRDEIHRKRRGGRPLHPGGGKAL